MAIFGNRAIVGAPDSVNTGYAAIFDVSTGALENTLYPPDGASGHKFGSSVALEGGLVIVGAPKATGKMAGSGKAYLFDATSGFYLHDFEADDGVTGDGFGRSVALDRGMALIGAPLVNSLVPASGAAYLFEVNYGFQFKKLAADDTHSFQLFGTAVALSGGLALIGAPGDSDIASTAGAVYGFDAIAGEKLYKIVAPDGKEHDQFGYFLSVSRNTAVIGAYENDDLGSSCGAGYVANPLVGPSMFSKRAQPKDLAPGTLGAVFSIMGEPFTNGNGQVAFPSTISGAGVTLANNQGVWNSLTSNGSLDLILRKNTDLGSGFIVARAFDPIINQPSGCVFKALLSGPAATPNNNVILFCDDGLSVNPLLRLRYPIATLGNCLPTRFNQIAQSNVTAKGLAVSFKLGLGTGSPAAIAANDSGFLFMSNNGAVFNYFRESGASAAGDAYGEFMRLGYREDKVAFVAGIQSAAATNQGVFRVSSLGATNALVARKGSTVPGAPGAVFSSFIGATETGGNEALFLATITGPGITPMNNVGLWYEHLGSVAPVARTGTPVPGFNGLVWGRFLKYWPIANFGGQVMVLANLRGPGVTTANDLGLFMLQEGGTWLKIVREGDPVPGCSSGVIGTIQTVIGSPPNYAIWATLSGVPASANQVLLTGRTDYPFTSRALRLPHLRLRKGAMLTADGTSGVVSSIAVPLRPYDATGAGCKGLGSPISGGQMTLRLRFSDGTVQVVEGPNW
jgi:hypothetical protein